MGSVHHFSRYFLSTFLPSTLSGDTAPQIPAPSKCSELKVWQSHQGNLWMRKTWIIFTHECGRRKRLGGAVHWECTDPLLKSGLRGGSLQLQGSFTHRAATFRTAGVVDNGVFMTVSEQKAVQCPQTVWILIHNYKLTNRQTLHNTFWIQLSSNSP